MSDNTFEFDEISLKLDCWIQVQAGERITKGFVETGIRKNLRIFVHSDEHNPCHFHIESKQRHFRQKFGVDNLNNNSKTKDHKFDAYIKKFFEKNPKYIEEIKEKFYELNPNLE